MIVSLSVFECRRRASLWWHFWASLTGLSAVTYDSLLIAVWNVIEIVYAAQQCVCVCVFFYLPVWKCHRTNNIVVVIVASEFRVFFLSWRITPLQMQKKTLRLWNEKRTVIMCQCVHQRDVRTNRESKEKLKRSTEWDSNMHTVTVRLVLRRK